MVAVRAEPALSMAGMDAGAQGSWAGLGCGVTAVGAAHKSSTEGKKLSWLGKVLDVSGKDCCRKCWAQEKVGRPAECRGAEGCPLFFHQHLNSVF